MADFIQPLDLYELLVNTAAGNIEIFLFASIILLSGFAAKFKMPNEIFVIMLFLFGVFLGNYVGGFYLMLLFLGGMFSFIAFARVFR